MKLKMVSRCGRTHDALLGGSCRIVGDRSVVPATAAALRMLGLAAMSLALESQQQHLSLVY